MASVFTRSSMVFLKASLRAAGAFGKPLPHCSNAGRWIHARGQRHVSSAKQRILVEVVLDDDIELKPLEAECGETLMELLSRSDVGDVWSDAGACGGACSCSTCRVIIEPAWRHDLCSTMPEPEDDELDMLESAANEFSHQGAKPWERNVMMTSEARTSAISATSAESDADREALVEEFLDGARLSCQIALTPEMSGLRVRLMGVGPNMMEVPLWMRTR